MRQGRLLIAMLAAVAIAAVAVPALAKDSHAPPGAGDRWLPCESWAMFHWLPFSERRLYALTGIDREEFRDHIRDDDKHTLSQLVRKHGKDPDAIVAQLVGRWRGKVGERQLAELTRRADALMTQGHLAQHVFFHYFHHPGLALNAKWVFGVRPADYHRARLRGWSPLEIGEQGGRTERQVVRRALSVLKRYQRRGVRTGQTSPGQAELFARLQVRAVGRWLHQDINRHRKGEFPRGSRGVKGTRLQRACAYFAGTDHPMGEHDDTSTRHVH